MGNSRYKVDLDWTDKWMNNVNKYVNIKTFSDIKKKLIYDIGKPIETNIIKYSIIKKAMENKENHE